MNNIWISPSNQPTVSIMKNNMRGFGTPLKAVCPQSWVLASVAK
jgi:hypothetical protein